MKIIRASEIGTFHFCRLAWWYQINGVKPENQLELSQGIDRHTRHNKIVELLFKLRIAGYLLMIVAVGILIVSFYLWLF